MTNEQFDRGVASILLSVVICLGILIFALSHTAAQDTGPTWEYVGITYANNNAAAITGDVGATLDLNKAFEQGMSIIDVFNVLGAAGWEYAGPVEVNVAVYVFKKPG